MVFAEDDYLLISGIQHFRFCRRQWALIHIESQWAENVRTVEGDALHRKAHDASVRERRGNLMIVRGMRLASPRLGLIGACDVVEFRADPSGVPLHGEDGLYLSERCASQHTSRRSRPPRGGWIEIS
ncbi:MAG: Dna2/Cas4 domain-containing protein, partial [Oscillospiraceae bacterium]|nr:Dna2/Cas4 domain-containing protein [Oscillospiraceae bacterium]